MRDEDIVRELRTKRVESCRLVRSTGLRKAVVTVATGGKHIFCSGPYDSIVEWEGCLVFAKRIGNTNWAVEVKLMDEQTDEDDTVLYAETQNGLHCFRNGPWVNRLVERAAAIRTLAEDDEQKQRMAKAKEDLSMFDKVDF